MKKLLMVTTLAVGILAGCSKDDGNNDSSGHNYKITVSVTGAGSGDFISVSAAGTNQQATATSVWKKNGAVQSGQMGIGLGTTDFLNGTTTYVLETTQPIAALANGVQIINFDAPLSYTYKIERDGKLEVNESGTLATNNANFTKQYNY